MTNWQDQQKAVATGVTDGTEKLQSRNEVIEEIATEIEQLAFAFGVDTAQSFAAFVRGMKS